MTIIDFDAAKCRPYLQQALKLFLNDPPESNYQRGYLAGLLAVYEEALGRRDDLATTCQRMLQETAANEGEV